MGPIGAQEMIAIFIIALVLFGPKKLPELGRLLGKGLSEFRRAKNELKSTFETHLSELEREARLENSTTAAKTPSTDYSSSSYTYPYEEYPSYDSTSSPEYEGRSVEPEPPQQPALEHSPVEGTVPRGNGVRPAEPASVAVEEHSE